jgi:hypothetical protein
VVSSAEGASIVERSVAGTLCSDAHPGAYSGQDAYNGRLLAFAFKASPVLSFKPGQSEAAGGIFVTEDYAPTLQAQNNGSTAVPAVMYGAAVRRLTPRECVPDNYTHITAQRQARRGHPALRRSATRCA